MFLVFCISTASGQLSIPVPNNADIKLFKSSTTYVVYSEDMGSDFNFEIEEVMENQWSETPYKMISASKFQTLRIDKSASFLYLNSAYFDEDKTHTAYNYLFLSLGNPSGNIEELTDLCAIPLEVKTNEDESYIYKLGLILEFMQHHINICDKNPQLNDKTIVDFYSTQEINFADYELLILKNEVEPSMKSISNVKKVYPYPFHFSSEEEILSAINEKRKNTLILHLIKAGENNFCVKFIADTNNGNLVYYNYHKTDSKKPSVFLEKDFKEIAK
jgi:hypothetical protein